jgi:hypothetical protein
MRTVERETPPGRPDQSLAPPDLFAANLRRADRTFEVLEQLGAHTLLVCSSVSADAVDDDDLAAEQLHALADRADRPSCWTLRARPVPGQLPRPVAW